MKNLPQASMLGTKMRSATEECEQRARRECGLGRHGWRGASKKTLSCSAYPAAAGGVETSPIAVVLLTSCFR